METIIQAIKDVFGAMTALGWLPIPAAIVSVAMLGLRVAFEPSILDVNTKEALATMGARKFQIFLAVGLVAIIVQVGAARPKDAFDYCTAIGFSFGNTMLAYVVTSSQKVKGLLKNQFVKGDTNVTPPSA